MVRKKHRGVVARPDRDPTAPRRSVGSDGLATSFVSPSREFLSKWSKKPNPKPFSLNDEARNTSKHHSSHFDGKLRLNRVAFVGAGDSSKEKMAESTIQAAVNAWDIEEVENAKVPPERSMANLNLDGPSEATMETGTSEASVKRARISNTTPTEEPLPTKGNSFFYIDRQGWKDRPHKSAKVADKNPAPTRNDELFFVDLQGSKDAAHKHLPKPTVRRSPSPTGSSSSEEVLLFTGREKSKGINRSLDGLLSATENKSNPVIIVDTIDSDKIHEPTSTELLTSRAHQKPIPPRSTISTSRGALGDAKFHEQNGRRRILDARKSKHDALLDDYIANMDSEDMKEITGQATLSARQLDTMDTSGLEDGPEESDERQRAESITSLSDAWDLEDLQDFDDRSSSSEILGEVKRVCSMRLRPSGLQYLVVYEGCTIDDARWIRGNTLVSGRTLDKIRLFELEAAKKTKYLTDSASEESDEDAQIAKDVQDDVDDYIDEQDLINGNVEHMTDEQIARLLAKQEELGIASEDVVLFDAASQPPRTRGSRRKRGGREFPSASLLADASDRDPYNGFDVMDTERPSLKNKSKGRRGTLPVELSDSELDQTLQASWANDRSKKKIRKQERDELRSQGLLGKKGKVDMKAKYSGGIQMAQVAEEVKIFLDSTEESLSLPPMGQRERKMVHELANVFGLKSKSTGDGTTRYPTLIRTKHTFAFDEVVIPKRISRSFGIFLPRKDKAAKRGGAVTRVARGGGFSKSAVTYADGDVVGASAAELGMENRGRSMLEKMGWSTGTALGALNNKGIMQPVTHTVKNSRTGLG